MCNRGLAKKDAHFRKVLLLVEEVSPWLRLVYALLIVVASNLCVLLLFVCVCVCAPGIAA